MGGGINIQSNLAFLGLSPRSSCAGFATGLLKTLRTQLKKQAKMTRAVSCKDTNCVANAEINMVV